MMAKIKITYSFFNDEKFILHCKRNFNDKGHFVSVLGDIICRSNGTYRTFKEFHGAQLSYVCSSIAKRTATLYEEKEMKIRGIIQQDLLDVAKIHKEAFSRQLHSEQWISCNFKAYPRIRLFVAEDEGMLIGYVQWVEKSGFRKEVVLELEQLAVLSSKQRQGIGSFNFRIFKVDQRGTKPKKCVYKTCFSID